MLLTANRFQEKTQKEKNPLNYTETMKHLQRGRQRCTSSAFKSVPGQKEIRDELL